jgi:outer membrane protein assembly factor BamB
MMYSTKSKLIVLVLIVISGLATGSDWPCWRGPESNGISTETDWNPEALNKNIKILWKIQIGQGHSAVSIKDNRIYTQGSRYMTTDSGKEYQETIICINSETGDIIWIHAYSVKPRSYNGPRATPLLDEDLLYSLGTQGDLYCLKSSNGEIVWNRNLVKDGLSKNSDWGFSGSPVISGDILLLNAGSSGLALNKYDGKVIWKSSQGKCGQATPVLIQKDGKKLALIKANYTLHAVETASGKILWTHPWPYCDADPVLVGHDLFLYGGKPSNQRGRTRLSLNSGKPEVLWHQVEMNVAFQSWVVYQGYAYGIRWDKKKTQLQCINLQSGDSKWRKTIDDWGSLIIADSYLILIEGDGDLVIAQASSDSFKEISRANIINVRESSELGEYQPHACWTHPVLASGCIFVRSSYGELVCVDMR